MSIHFYLKSGIPVRNRMVTSGKNSHLKSYATIGQTEIEVSHDARGTYFYSGEFSFDKSPCQGNLAVELAKATEHLTYSSSLPDGCLREVGTYSLEGTSARVTESAIQGRKYNLVFVTAPNFKSLQAVWQALLDGTIRPERPLFNKEQQGLSYEELAATNWGLTKACGDLESQLIHAREVIKSCSDVLAQQRREIDRTIAERDDARRQLTLSRAISMY